MKIKTQLLRKSRDCFNGIWKYKLSGSTKSGLRGEKRLKIGVVMFQEITESVHEPDFLGLALMSISPDATCNVTVDARILSHPEIIADERGFPAPSKSFPLQWRHNGRHGVSDHQAHGCLLNRLFRHRSKKTSKLRVTGLCAAFPRTNGQ